MNPQRATGDLRLRWALLLVFVLGVMPARGQTTQPTVSAVAKIGMVVEEMDRSIDFYTTVLDFRKVSDDEVLGAQHERLTGVFGARSRVAQLQLGQETIELTEYLAPRGRAIPRDSRSNDHWFQHIAIVTTDMRRAYERLRRHNVRHASTAPQRLPDWNPSAGGIEAFYFRDPDDHVLEVISFPDGKGDPRWQGRRELFPGIDHTAIVVSDTDKSLRFYRDALGLRVAGGSENYGIEQEHLNLVFGARLRITTLRAATGPGVELLEYLTPRDGRPYPADARANDLFHWQTTLLTPDATATLGNLAAGGSLRPISAAPAMIDSTAAALIRDPDGHAIQIVESPRLSRDAP